MISRKVFLNPRPFMFIVLLKLRMIIYYNQQNTTGNRHFSQLTNLSINHSLTHPNGPGWDIRPSLHYFSTSRGPWRSFQPPPRPSQAISGLLSQFSARWSLIFSALLALRRQTYQYALLMLFNPP